VSALRDVALLVPPDEHYTAGLQPNGDVEFTQSQPSGEVVLMTIKRDAVAELAAFLARAILPPTTEPS
jgi:hypothetical protein